MISSGQDTVEWQLECKFREKKVFTAEPTVASGPVPLLNRTVEVSFSVMMALYTSAISRTAQQSAEVASR